MFNGSLLNQVQAISSRDGLLQREREAIIDLLLLGMYADNYISSVENDVILQVTADFDWKGVGSAAIYTNTATYKVRTATDSKASENELLTNIALRLSSHESQHTATNLLSKLLNADDTNEAENAFLRRVYDIFG